jgi:hypothetical protein
MERAIVMPIREKRVSEVTPNNMFPRMTGNPQPLRRFVLYRKQRLQPERSPASNKARCRVCSEEELEKGARHPFKSDDKAF